MHFFSLCSYWKLSKSILIACFSKGASLLVQKLLRVGVLHLKHAFINTAFLEDQCQKLQQQQLYYTQPRCLNLFPWPFPQLGQNQAQTEISSSNMVCHQSKCTRLGSSKPRKENGHSQVMSNDEENEQLHTCTWRLNHAFSKLDARSSASTKPSVNLFRKK